MAATTMQGAREGMLVAPPGAAPKSAPVSMIGRVMAVLGAFVAEGPQLRTGDIARVTGLPSATTSRLLRELVDFGALQRLARGRYAIGTRLWEVGALGASVYQVWGAARPRVLSLSRATGCPAHLTLLSGREGLRMEETAGESTEIAPCWVVERVPLHATAAGLVLLAFGPDELLEQVLEGPLTRYTQHTVVSGSRLLSTLEEVRRTGVALSREQHHLGHASMAAPLLDAEGHAVGAVEVMIRHQTETRRLHGILSGCAHQLTEQLSLECSHRMSRNDHSDRSPAKPVSPSDRERRPE